MEEGANKSVGIPNFVSLALGTCELNKYTILFVVVTVVDVAQLNGSRDMRKNSYFEKSCLSNFDITWCPAG